MPLQEEAAEIILKGSPICRGIAIGKPFFLTRHHFAVFEMQISPSQTQKEIERYRQALSRSKQDIKRLQKQLEMEAVDEGILILDAQLEMLQDPLLTLHIEKEIRKNNKNAEFVFQQALLAYQHKFQSLKDSFFAERFKDLQDLAHRIFNYLYESNAHPLWNLPPHTIVCAQELTASDAASAHSTCVSAFLSEEGGATTHAAIVAKAKGIPYVTNIPIKELKKHTFSLLIVDGRNGKIIINPSPNTLKEYEALKDRLQDQVQDLEKMIKWPAQTFEGHPIRLCANLDMIHEIDLIHALGGQGIGLFRSEYIFLPKSEIPSEDEQFEIYYRIVMSMKGLPVVIRTFDFGGDKAITSHSFSNERNSFIGCRAIRFLLKEKELFKIQIRAILRASLLGKLSILLPMISTLTDLREAKQMIEEVKKELQMTHHVRLGCMIEIPSAALLIDHLTKECDFFSIGTNDLVQYALAIDRSDQTLSEAYQPTDPSIIRLIKLLINESNKANIPVSVCGEIASDPRFTALLLGLGVQELSVAPRYLPLIKNAIRRTSIVDAVHLAEKVLTLTTSQEVLNLLTENYQKIVPNDLFYLSSV